MTDYVRINISTLDRETDPAPLPHGFVGLAQNGPGSIEDLSWTTPNFADAFVGKGYWPTVERRAQLTEFERYAVPPIYVIDAAAKVVYADYGAEPWAPAEIKAAKQAALLAELAATDLGMSRVIEEILSVLLAKGVIAKDDVSASADAKVQARADLRQQLANLG